MQCKSATLISLLIFTIIILTSINEVESEVYTYSQLVSIKNIKQFIRSSPEIFIELNTATEILDSPENGIKICSASLFGRHREASQYKELIYSSEYLTNTFKGGIIYYNEGDLIDPQISKLNVSVIYSPSNWDNFVQLYYQSIKSSHIHKCTINFKGPYLLFPIEIEKSLILTENSLLEYISAVSQQTFQSNEHIVNLNNNINKNQNKTNNFQVITQSGRNKIPYDYYIFDSPSSSDYYFNFDNDYPQVVSNAKLIGKIKAITTKNHFIENLALQITLQSWQPLFSYIFPSSNLPFSVSLPHSISVPSLKQKQFVEMDKNFKLFAVNATGAKLNSFSVPSSPHFPLFNEAIMSTNKNLGLFLGYLQKKSIEIIKANTTTPHIPLFKKMDKSSFAFWPYNEQEIAKKLEYKIKSTIQSNSTTNDILLLNLNEFYKLYYSFTEIIRNLPNIQNYLTFSNMKFNSDSFSFSFQFENLKIPNFYPSSSFSDSPSYENKKEVKITEIVMDIANKFQLAPTAMDYYHYFLPKLSSDVPFEKLSTEYQIFTNAYSSENSLISPEIIKIFYRYLFTLQLICEMELLNVANVLPELLIPASKVTEIDEPEKIKNEIMERIKDILNEAIENAKNDDKNNEPLPIEKIEKIVTNALEKEFIEQLSKLSFKTYLISNDLKFFNIIRTIIYTQI